ncbi:DEAD/DEAH box helicase [Jeotgalibacillus proteolyticus]|uniref:ATP-dependent helicase n=1 Tax=Jeotgalibacillus proteolyticus TaxID=2082395 RepID=A0A2S5GEQ8_9BACL|nr:SNF2-related protein [Jeotgalibacillus proteolyticus]PPA71394.1 ATP-dependent helicase [Jeotgalibacillus proteolyticus]
MNHSLHFQEPGWASSFLSWLESPKPPVHPSLLLHSIQARKEECLYDAQSLSCLHELEHLTPHPHQLDAAKKVIFEMGGRALLADEVGLGKTIEAGLILKEYITRGHVKSVLILVPASLGGQWQSELGHHFGLSSIVHKGKKEWREAPITIATIDLLKRPPLREQIEKNHYDMVIVDEAHKLTNPKTLNYQFIQSLSKSYCLFLTATPIQNKSEDLYFLSTLLRPGLLGSLAEFREASKDDTKKEAIKNKLNEFMIRTRRKETTIEWTKREIHVEWIDQLPYEKDLYHAVENFYHEQKEINMHAFSHITLLKQSCSSIIALLKALNRDANKEISSRLGVNLDVNPDQLITAKAERILSFIKNTDEKVIVFTQYRATQLYLSWFLKQNNISSVPFRGGFKKGKKQWMTDLFRDKAQVLIATEAGSEGLNLQFCRYMIHADIPWNPMKLEQRIGRIHRIGQNDDVKIFYLLNRNTIEERIWHVLQEKVSLFKYIIGEHDDLLSSTTAKELNKYLEDAFLHSRSEQEMRLKLNQLEHFYELSSLEEEA